jgi:hypothetical protein
MLCVPEVYPSELDHGGRCLQPSVSWLPQRSGENHVHVVVQPSDIVSLIYLYLHRCPSVLEKIMSMIYLY